jgi:hypothetical protein
VALLFVLSAPMVGQNLVTNGGFETGDFTGWTQTGDTGYSGVCADGSPSVDCSGYKPLSGLFMGSFGPIGSMGGITQNLNTIAGHSYEISFFLSNGAAHPDAFSINFGGVTLVSGTNVGWMKWQFFQFSEVATSDSTPLSFSFYQVPDYYDLDNVSVVEETPEPASLILLASAISIGAATRRRSTI